MSVIEINNLTKDYEVGFWRKRKVRALDGLSLSIDGGQIFGFLGANGAGKTTTLKLLMRLIFPTTGSARILGDVEYVASNKSSNTFYGLVNNDWNGVASVTEVTAAPPYTWRP